MTEYYGPTTIETAVITNVDMAKWTVDVATQYSSKQLTGIPWCSPYLHHESGEGYLLVPEVDAQCLLCTPSDGESSPFILGYLPIPKGDSYRSNRIDMNPGDMGLMTRDGNYMILRRGGVVQIGATQIAQRLYIPIANTIRDFAQNYSLTTFGGECVWEVDADRTEQEKTPTRWKLRAKQFAEDTLNSKEYYPVEICVGRTLPNGDPNKKAGEQNLKSSQLANTDTPLLEVTVALQNESGFQFAVDGRGNFFVHSGGSSRWDFEKDLVYNVKGNRTVTVSGIDKVKAVTRIEEYEQQQMKANSSSENIDGTKTIAAKSVLLGNLSSGSLDGVVLGNALLFWLSQGALVVPGAGTVTLNPLLGQATLIMSETVKATK